MTAKKTANKKIELTQIELDFVKLAVTQFRHELSIVNSWYISTITTLGREGAIEIMDKVTEKLKQ